MQRKIEDAKIAFKAQTFEVSGANEKIKVVVNGARELVSLKIDPDFLKSEGIDLVQDAIIGTINAGLSKAGEQLDAHVEKLTGGMKVPGVY